MNIMNKKIPVYLNDFGSIHPFFKEMNTVDQKQKEEIYNKFISIFNRSLKTNTRKIITPTIMKASEGCTGFTQICGIPIEDLKDDKEFMKQVKKVSEVAHQALLKRSNEMIKFILKFHNQKELFDNEQQSGEIMKLFALSVPQNVSIDTKNASNIAAYMQKKHISKAYTYNKSTDRLSFMPEFQGTTLSSMLKNRRVLNFQGTKDLNKMFEKFGEIAIYDLAIGNTDRFFRFNFEKNKLDEGINSGNVMLHIPINSKTKKRELREIHAIDNATFPNLLYEKKAAINDNEDKCDLGGLFDEDENEDEVASLSLESGENKEKTLDQQQQIYTDMLKKKINYTELSKLIIKGFQNELSSKGYSEKEIENIKKNMNENLMKGFKNGISKLREKNFNSLFENLKQSWTDPISLSTFKFMKRNFKALSQIE